MALMPLDYHFSVRLHASFLEFGKPSNESGTAVCQMSQAKVEVEEAETRETRIEANDDDDEVIRCWLIDAESLTLLCWIHTIVQSPRACSCARPRAYSRAARGQPVSRLR